MTDDLSPHDEEHKSTRIGWIRAAVLGVNDGIVSTSSLMLGVAAAAASAEAILTAGIAGLVAGASSMAIGEYVSVSSQRDSEEADIAIEARSLENDPEGELNELAKIYEERGLRPELAREVAEELHRYDAVLAHARDELGLDHRRSAQPFQAAWTSAVSFSVGALFPVVAALLTFTYGKSTIAIILASLLALAISGALGAYFGGGNRYWAAGRVLLGGSIAMAVTALIGHLVGGLL